MIRKIIISGWLLSGLLAIGIIFAVIYLELTGRPTPNVLENWGGVIIGFYFGQLASFIKDYIDRHPSDN